MKRISTLIILIFCAMAHLWAQKNTPQEKSIVNKEFDKDGNLIQYDSTFVWQWNSDSTMNFSFDENFGFGKEFPGMFEEFFGDSVFENFGFFNDQNFPSFNNEEFFQHFQHSFHDSAFIHGFTFEPDSAGGFGFRHHFPGGTAFPDLEELQKQMLEKFNHQNMPAPGFKSPEQQKEWEELLKKQQKEKEELMKKWEKG